MQHHDHLRKHTELRVVFLWTMELIHRGSHLAIREQILESTMSTITRKSNHLVISHSYYVIVSRSDILW